MRTVTGTTSTWHDNHTAWVEAADWEADLKSDSYMIMLIMHHAALAWHRHASTINNNLFAASGASTTTASSESNCNGIMIIMHEHASVI